MYGSSPTRRINICKVISEIHSHFFSTNYNNSLVVECIYENRPTLLRRKANEREFRLLSTEGTFIQYRQCTVIWKENFRSLFSGVAQLSEHWAGVEKQQQHARRLRQVDEEDGRGGGTAHGLFTTAFDCITFFPSFFSSHNSIGELTDRMMVFLKTELRSTMDGWMETLILSSRSIDFKVNEAIETLLRQGIFFSNAVKNEEFWLNSSERELCV